MGMKIAIDFDGVVVREDREYDDLTTPLELVPGALEALQSLKSAGHLLILWSDRANLSLRRDWGLDPLKAKLAKKLTLAKLPRPKWEDNYELHEARYQQMIDFVARELPNLFDSIDNGEQGKITADVYFDNRAERAGSVDSWKELVQVYGDEFHDTFEPEELS